MANGEIVAVGILGVMVSIIWFSFHLALNLGKDHKDEGGTTEEHSSFLSHYPLRFFFLFFGIFLIYITMYQAYSFGLNFIPVTEQPFYSLTTLLTFPYVFFMVSYFMLYFIILVLDRLDLLTKIKHRWRMR